MIISHRQNRTGVGVAVYLQKPMRRTINVYQRPFRANDPREFDVSGKHFLSFPNMLFKIYYRKNPHFGPFNDVTKYSAYALGVVFTGDYVEGKTPKLYTAPLMNVNVGMTCSGDSFQQRYFSTVEEVISFAIGNFWQTKFNNDITSDWYCYPIQSMMFNYHKWAIKTKKDPSWYPHSKILVPYPYPWSSFCESNNQEMLPVE